MPNPLDDPQPIESAVDDIGMFATDHDEDCQMHFYAGFGVGCVVAMFMGFVFSYL